MQVFSKMSSGSDSHANFNLIFIFFFNFKTYGAKHSPWVFDTLWRKCRLDILKQIHDQGDKIVMPLVIFEFIWKIKTYA